MAAEDALAPPQLLAADAADEAEDEAAAADAAAAPAQILPDIETIEKHNSAQKQHVCWL